MKPPFWALATVVATIAAASAVQSQAPADTKETIRRTLRWSGSGERTIELSNISGSIRVVGYDGRDVEMVAVQTIRADSDDAVAEAKRSVRLDVTEGAQVVRVCADADRCGCGVEHWDRRRDDRYRVSVNFDLRVPRDATLRLCTVNSGSVTVDGTAGDFDITNVNGAIQMTDVRGSGRAHTVNGRVSATFAASPTKASSFKTVNGAIEVTFPQDLSADLRLNTLHGGLYTDFDVVPLPAAAATGERRNGAWVFRSNPFASVRVGNGGPVISLQGLNGDVRVLRAK